MHMDKGVKFHLDQPVKEIKGANGKVCLSIFCTLINLALEKQNGDKS